MQDFTTIFGHAQTDAIATCVVILVTKLACTYCTI